MPSADHRAPHRSRVSSGQGLRAGIRRRATVRVLYRRGLAEQDAAHEASRVSRGGRGSTVHTRSGMLGVASRWAGPLGRGQVAPGRLPRLPAREGRPRRRPRHLAERRGRRRRPTDPRSGRSRQRAIRLGGSLTRLICVVYFRKQLLQTWKRLVMAEMCSYRSNALAR